MKKYFFSIIALYFLVCSCGQEQKKEEKPLDFPTSEDTLRSGDIIFQTSNSGQSKAIQLATHSKYSHCGILFLVDTGDYYWRVLEAVQPVKFTPLDKWIARGDGGHYVVKRLKHTPILSAMFNSFGEYIGKDYDLYFSWSDEKMYCSELVWKFYKEETGLEVGKLQELKEFDLSNPIVKKKLKERYGKNIPYNEKVISPAAIFDSELLKTVIEK